MPVYKLFHVNNNNSFYELNGLPKTVFLSSAKRKKIKICDIVNSKDLLRQRLIKLKFVEKKEVLS